MATKSTRTGKKPRSLKRAKEDIQYSYRSGLRPVIIVEFTKPQEIGGFYGGKRRSLEFIGRQKGSTGDKWIEWGNWGINFYFTTNKGQSWKDSLKYAKSWITRNTEKGTVKKVTVEWEKA